jgi:hypothetical protein
VTDLLARRFARTHEMQLARMAAAEVADHPELSAVDDPKAALDELRAAGDMSWAYFTPKDQR